MWVVQRLVKTLETSAGDVRLDTHEDVCGCLLVYRSKEAAEGVSNGTEPLELMETLSNDGKSDGQ